MGVTESETSDLPPLDVIAARTAILLGALVPGGVLFCSNPRSLGMDAEGWDGERYGCTLTAESWTRMIETAGFVLERQFLRPSGKPPGEQPWLAMVWRLPTSRSGRGDSR